MRYLLMVCRDERAFEALGPDEVSALEAEFAAYNEELTRRGVMLGGERLRRTSDATSVQVREGEVLVADGPFAETKEQIGGYCLVECRDLDEAIEVAARVPVARMGTIEVRPIWER